MAEIEYAVDIWDLSGTDGRPNAEQLLEHLRNFAEEGWELVSLSFNIDLVRLGQATSWCSSELGMRRAILLALTGAGIVVFADQLLPAHRSSSTPRTGPTRNRSSVWSG